MNLPAAFKTALLLALALLSGLCSFATALELSDIHMPMKRDEADATLSKDYSYAVMTDGSVRRSWRLEGKELIIDFDTVSNDAIMVAIIYDKPVSKKKGIDDAHAIAAGKFDEKATWDNPKDREAKSLIENTYGLKNARRKKLDDKAMLFYEMDQKKSHITRVSLFARMPHTNRWALTTLTKNSGKTAMGNQMSTSFITSLYEDEERRQNTPLATPKQNELAAETEQPAAPRFTITVNSSSTTAPAKTPTPKAATAEQTDATAAATAQRSTHTQQAPKPATPAAPRPAQPVASATPPAPAPAPAPAAADAEANKLEPGRHTMSLLPPPPDWLKAAGVEEPTWWHYLAAAVILLLILVFIIRSFAQSAGRAAQRKRFADVVAQGNPPAKGRRR